MSRATKLLYLNVALLIGSLVLWGVASWLGWLESVAFVSHISMAALVFTAISGIAGANESE